MVESFTYDAYGTILAHTQTAQTLNPYAYTGREFESKDLYYYRARYYDPTVGRFISQDPIEFMAGDVNFYRYVGSDPVNFRDPSGLYSLREFGYDATKNIAGVCNSLTFGLTGWIGKQINTHNYGEAIANRTDQAIENSIGQQATDIGMVATGVGGLAKGGFKGAKVLYKNRKAFKSLIKSLPKLSKNAAKAVKCEAEKGAKKVGERVKRQIQKLKCAVIKGLKNKACNRVGLKKIGGKNNASLRTMKNYLARNNFDNITCLSIYTAIFATKMCIHYRRVATVLVRQKKCIGSKKKNTRRIHKDKIIEQKERLEALKNIKKGKGC